MGMFDSVFARCPGCGEKLAFQSKAGLCHLKKYSVYSVPPEIARQIHGKQIVCPCCGKNLVLLLDKPVERVSMSLLEDCTEEEWEEYD